MGRKRKDAGGAKIGKNNDESSVEILPYLFLGPRSAASESFLHSHGIKHVLSIGASPPTTLPNVAYTRIPLVDSPTASLGRVYGRAAEAINGARKSGGKILVHCSAAVSRSPTIVTAYLMTEQGMTLKEALGHVVRARPAVNPNPGLFEQLKELEVSLKGSCSLDVEALPSQKEQRIALFAPEIGCSGYEQDGTEQDITGEQDDSKKDESKPIDI